MHRVGWGRADALARPHFRVRHSQPLMRSQIPGSGSALTAGRAMLDSAPKPGVCPWEAVLSGGNAATVVAALHSAPGAPGAGGVRDQHPASLAPPSASAGGGRAGIGAAARGPAGPQELLLATGDPFWLKRVRKKRSLLHAKILVNARTWRQKSRVRTRAGPAARLILPDTQHSGSLGPDRVARARACVESRPGSSKTPMFPETSGRRTGTESAVCAGAPEPPRGAVCETAFSSDPPASGELGGSGVAVEKGTGDTGAGGGAGGGTQER